jgi:hypothetical protein
MNKIIFAAALLVLLTLTIAVGVTTTQYAKAVITENCPNTQEHPTEQCLTHDLRETAKAMLRGLLAP